VARPQGFHSLMTVFTLRETLMKNTSYKIYALAVCFVTLMCSAIITGVVLYNLVKIAAPELTLDSHSYNAHQSIDAFRSSQFYAFGRPVPALIAGGRFRGRPGLPIAGAPEMSGDESPTISDDELEKLRAQSYESVLRGQRRSAVQSTIRSSIILLVSLSLFFMHWRLVKRGNSDGDKSDGAGIQDARESS